MLGIIVRIFLLWKGGGGKKQAKDPIPGGKQRSGRAPDLTKIGDSNALAQGPFIRALTI